MVGFVYMCMDYYRPRDPWIHTEHCVCLQQICYHQRWGLFGTSEPTSKEVILVSSGDYLVEAYSGRCSFASNLHDGFHASKVDPAYKPVLEKNHY